MAKQTINIGSSLNDNTGDMPRVAFDKCNDNFDELYDHVEASTNNVAGDGTITQVVKVTQAEYDALTPVATTLYVVVG